MNAVTCGLQIATYSFEALIIVLGAIMKSKVATMVGLLATIPLFQNCSNPISVANDLHQVTTQNSISSTTSSEEDIRVANPNNKIEIAELHYFRGGWFGTYPNWAADIQFSNKIADTVTGTLSIVSKHTDPECYRPVTQISKEEQEKLTSLIANLQIKVIDQSQGPFMVDGGTHTLRIRYASGSVKEQFISFSEYQEGALINHFAVNGADLAQYIEALSDRLDVVCQ